MVFQTRAKFFPGLHADADQLPSEVESDAKSDWTGGDNQTTPIQQLEQKRASFELDASAGGSMGESLFIFYQKIMCYFAGPAEAGSQTVESKNQGGQTENEIKTANREQKPSSESESTNGYLIKEEDRLTGG
jgi:hypothetical protein